eukprot:14960124-Heterocapsa_arctica.AAC.1
MEGLLPQTRGAQPAVLHAPPGLTSPVEPRGNNPAGWHTLPPACRETADAMERHAEANRRTLEVFAERA